jgi:hypothetical protein
MKSSSYKKIIIAVIIQLLAASVFGQKYENGTKLLKGAEVLSATPLQLDYVLERLADTAKITVNLHEGKTHLVLDDGSGKWREWWYHEGKWKVKSQGSDPVPQVNADWNATSGAAQILNKPTSFIANQLSYYKRETSDIHNWLDGAGTSTLHYLYNGVQHDNAPTPTQTETYYYLGLTTNSTNFYSLIAINRLRSNSSSNVYIKDRTNANWSSWKHIGDGSDAATLEGKKASELFPIIKQSTEPTISDESFAFWVDGSTFYLILRSGGTQKKLQFN